MGPRARCRAALLRLYTSSLYRYAVGAADAGQGIPPRSTAHRRHRQYLCVRSAVGSSDSSEPSEPEVDETGGLPLTSRHRRRFTARYRNARDECRRLRRCRRAARWFPKQPLGLRQRRAALFALRHEQDRSDRARAERDLVVQTVPTMNKFTKVGKSNLYN